MHPGAWVFFLSFWLEFCAWVLVFSTTEDKKACITHTAVFKLGGLFDILQGDKKSTQQVNYGKTTPSFPKKSYWLPQGMGGN